MTTAEDIPGHEADAAKAERLAKRLRLGASLVALALGVGFGLAICRRIVRGFGGDIWIEPVDGPGTTVAVRLPEYASVRRLAA